VGDHPVKVPAELVKELAVGARLPYTPATEAQWQQRFAQRAAQWAADQELEASNNWLVLNGYGEAASRLRAARRPKPPSLAGQGMEALNKGCFPSNDEIATIRAALNRLAELEANQ
jgi:hypothetical protein